jgi:hypothetical protein
MAEPIITTSVVFFKKRSMLSGAQITPNPALQQLMNKLSDADREQAWEVIRQQLRPLEGPNGFEAPGEVLIVVGTT